MPHTPLLDALTDAIANPRTVRLSQERASARTYAGLDRKVKAIRDISPEVMPGTPSANNSRATSRAPSRAPSRGHSSDRQSRTESPRPNARIELQRSHSELPLKSPSIQAKAEITPCITAMELNPEQIKRNYSVDDLQSWDKRQNPLPPLPTMTGLFRYRTAATADPQWRYEHFRKQVKGVDHMVSQLDMSDMTGMTKEEWAAVTDFGIPRRGSAVSSHSQSTRTTLSCETPEPCVDPQTGTRVARGFSPSPASSTRSSFKEGLAHSRKGSTLSTTSFPTDLENAFKRTPGLPAPPPPLERRASNQLSTITELQSNMTDSATRKVEKPCEFTDRGDPDSAVASDAEDDEDEAWTDVVEKQPGKVSAITRMIKNGKTVDDQTGRTKVRSNSSERRRTRGSTTSLNRTNTIRNIRPQPQRRRSSRTKGVLPEKANSGDKKDQDHVRFKLPVPQHDGSESTMMPFKSEDEQNPANVKSEEPTISVGISQDDTSPFDLPTTDDSTLVEAGGGHLSRAQRNRSATALFCRQDMSALQKAIRDHIQ